MLDISDAFFISNNSKIVSRSFAMGIPFINDKPREKISRDIAVLVDNMSKK
jgi:hypothetical protein